MERTLMILEVSQKQRYIFSSRRLRENAARSWEIGHVIGSGFFREAAGELYREEEQLVYTGGGHTVLEFPSRQEAAAFARQVTAESIRRFPGMEVFVKLLPYDQDKTPGENLTDLSNALEAKKSVRRASFRTVSLGVEDLDSEGYAPLPVRRPRPTDAQSPVKAPEGLSFPMEFEKLALAEPEKDNFIAMVHIDGNAMGNRVAGIYERNTDSWEHCKTSLRQFSEGIQADFESAFRKMTEDILAAGLSLQDGILPVRPVILAGDDVCFVTAGNIGLECAGRFVEHLTAMVNQEDKKPYAACAGIALVHQKYPAYRAYELAEELCSSAKRLGAALDPARRVSLMDWHIEFGQLKDSLGDLRRDYCTEDDGRLELRPLILSAPEDLDLPDSCGPRTYAAFRRMVAGLQRAIRENSIPRSKIKELRNAMKEGEIETRFFLQDRQLHRLLDIVGGSEVFLPDETGQKRCLLFDAIELLDHFIPFREVTEK